MTTSPPELGHLDEPPSWPDRASLAEILVDVCGRMCADTATVLLVDRSRTVLESIATAGLHRTTRGAPRVPIGHGFAGRVAQLRQPVVLDEVDPRHVIDPALIDHRVRSLLGVPIMAGSELLGVLHVGQQEHRDFSESEILALTELANALGGVLQRRFDDASQTAALALQRSLLPTTLRVPDGIQVAARYVPAEGELGGDWYDVFELPDERLVLVMGDVIGHGLSAAIIMGRLRSALRAYALEHDDPAEVLNRLDRKIHHFEPDGFATVLIGIARAPYDEWHFSSAGHLAPIVAEPGRAPVPADVAGDRLLGLGEVVARRTTKVVLPPDGMLCMFTDGLVERRPTPEDGDRDIVGENIGHVCDALAGLDDAENACIRVLWDVVGDHPAEDDIALLVARRT